MTRITRHAMASSLLCALAAGVASGAEAVKLAPEAQRALEQFEAGAERLERAQAAAAALASGQRAQGEPKDWQRLPENFEAALKGLHAAPDLPLPDAAGIPPDQLRACGSRATALSHADRASRAMQTAAARCVELRTPWRERRAALKSAQAAWRSLRKVLAGLPEKAMADELFPASWTAREDPVGRSIDGILQAIARQDDRLDRCQTELRGRAAALGALVAEVSRARDCALAGQWAGVTKHAGTVSGMTLQLVASGGTWTGSANIAGLALATLSVALTGQKLAVILGDGRGALNGTLAADGKTFTGTYSSAEGPATFTLHKQ